MLEHKYRQLLAQAGITLNGTEPWDIKILDKRTYQRVFLNGSIGLGESYVDNWWESEQLDEFFNRLLYHFTPRFHNISHPINLIAHLKSNLINLQQISRSFTVGKKHYNLGNNLYECMLDPYMNYSCGYWKNAKDINTAQLDKMNLICKKLCLEPGMKVLDIGCGWGGMAKYMAENYDVSITGITISTEQEKYAREFCKGLDIKIQLTDYRALTNKYDRVYSIGMFEHVGHKNYSTYMKIVSELLDKDSIFVLQTIGCTTPKNHNDPWIEKYIFPNSLIPSHKQIISASEKNFIIEDWQNLGMDYDKTLIAWYENFKDNWDKIKHHYDDRFYRLWKFYLLASAGTFRSHYNQLWQIVLSPHGVSGGSYRAPR